jgi:hypothetical protein
VTLRAAVLVAALAAALVALAFGRRPDPGDASPVDDARAPDGLLAPPPLDARPTAGTTSPDAVPGASLRVEPDPPTRSRTVVGEITWPAEWAGRVRPSSAVVVREVDHRGSTTYRDGRGDLEPGGRRVLATIEGTGRWTVLLTFVLDHVARTEAVRFTVSDESPSEVAVPIRPDAGAHAVAPSVVRWRARIVDRDGRAVEGATVALARRAADARSFDRLASVWTSDPHGEVSADVASGAYFFQVEARGGATAAGEVDLARERETVVVVEEPRARLVVRVTGHDGAFVQLLVRRRVGPALVEVEDQFGRAPEDLELAVHEGVSHFVVATASGKAPAVVVTEGAREGTPERVVLALERGEEVLVRGIDAPVGAELFAVVSYDDPLGLAITQTTPLERRADGWRLPRIAGAGADLSVRVGDRTLRGRLPPSDGSPRSVDLR